MIRNKFICQCIDFAMQHMGISKQPKYHRSFR